MDLTTRYLGLKLKTPLVASSSPLCKEISTIRQLEDGGASAIVLHSLFEEQINLESNELDYFLSVGSDVSAEALEMFPDMTAYNIGPDDYLEHIRKAKAAVKVPIIASLNGISTGGWIRYAKEIQQAGADALELNIYYLPTDVELTGSTVEKAHCELVTAIKDSISIPIAVKLAPYFSSIPNVAKQLDEAGANALVLFNRFYQPDFDLERLEVVPSLVLSRSNEVKLRLHWTAILYDQIKADIAITGGVHTAEDVVKCMMAGAKVAMMTSAILEYGPQYFGVVQKDLERWMEEHEYESVKLMQGSMSMQKVSNPSAFQRANYMKVLSSYTLTPGPTVQRTR